MQRRLFLALVVFLYACAVVQFSRYYAHSAQPYLYMPAYISGHERLPFQERILPMLLLRPLYTHGIMDRLARSGSDLAAERRSLFLLGCIGLAAAAVLTQMLYHRVSRHRTLALLVFPLFLFTVIWTYSIHCEANFAYPYDMLSLAFFTGGLLCIYERKFLPLLLILLAGTANRETTLFLIGIYVLDAASVRPGNIGIAPSYPASLARHFNFRAVRWLRVALLLVLWTFVKAMLAYRFRQNDTSEHFDRLIPNLHLLKPRLLPALLNICGYILPIALVLWSRIRPQRFGGYAWIFALWLPVMFYSGVLLETRIYGELCSWTAVALVLLAEDQVAATSKPSFLPLQTAIPQPQMRLEEPV